MSTGTSVPKPRVSGMDVSDSALLATLLSEAPIGFAFLGEMPALRHLRGLACIGCGLAAIDGRAWQAFWAKRRYGRAIG